MINGIAGGSSSQMDGDRVFDEQSLYGTIGRLGFWRSSLGALLFWMYALSR